MNYTIRTLGMLVLVSSIVLAGACHTPSRSRTTIIVNSPNNHMPPGQAKKIYGQQSAKAFAPGQQKKKKTTTVVVRN